MGERRVEATIIGPGPSGWLRVRLGAIEADVPAEALPAELRMPEARFVAVVTGRTFVRVEPADRWLDVQDRVRVVLNERWDPIGVAGEVSDEYDSYVADLYGLLARRAPNAEIVAYLRWVETDRMGLRPSSDERLLDVARTLSALDLPSVG